MDKKLKEIEVAEILDVDKVTVKRMRDDGTGPPWIDLKGGYSIRPIIRYDEQEFRTWLKTRQHDGVK